MLGVLRLPVVQNDHNEATIERGGDVTSDLALSRRADVAISRVMPLARTSVLAEAVRR